MLRGQVLRYRPTEAAVLPFLRPRHAQLLLFRATQQKASGGGERFLPTPLAPGTNFFSYTSGHESTP